MDPTVANLPDAPLLESVVFSDNGFEVYATFDAETNRAGITAPSFSCLDLLVGPDLRHEDECFWVSDDSVRMLPTALEPGSVVNVKAHTLAAKCAPEHDADSCTSDYPTSPDSVTVYAYPPSNIIPPVVQAQYKGEVSECEESFTIDVSGSYNNGGRSFTAINWTYVGDASEGAPYTYLVEQARSETAHASSTLTASIAQLVAGNSYQFTVVIRNWLGGEDSTTVIVRIVPASDPVVEILGPTERVLAPSAAFELYARDELGCAATPGSDIVERSWTETTGNLQLDAVDSASQRPQTLPITAFMLTARETYVFEYRVTTSDAKTSNATVKVEVTEDVLIVDVLGCNQTVSLADGGAHVVDAQYSYDAELGPSIAGAAAGIASTFNVSFSGTPYCNAMESVFWASSQYIIEPSNALAGCRLEMEITAAKGART
mmetsp:Transcript_43038/g.135067  ORF Transcript_43038/g.135067 Transcript_43038/m.135067 type:complete len:432 (+) Transcript_43038:473-1768(+)